MKMLISEKGKDFNGHTLNEDNVKGNQYVLYKKKIYKTGNRYHTMVELYDVYGNHKHNADTGSIRLLKYVDR